MYSGKVKIAFLFILAGILASCARPIAENSTVTIGIPTSADMQKLGTFALTTDDKMHHLIINISGPGFSPIAYHWEGCRECSTPGDAPAVLSFVVPTGENRLIQVLAVYKNSNTNEMLLYYGDAAPTLNTDTANVNIGITKAGSGSLISGNVSGRYFTGANTGPTGILDIRYMPPGGKPGMIVGQSSIYDGWFSAMVFSGADVMLSVRPNAFYSGTTLWNQAVNLDSSFFDPAANANYVVKAAVPVHKRSHSGTYYAEEPSIFVWGFWENLALNPNVLVCRDFSGSIANLKKYDATGTPLTLSLGSSFPTTANLMDTTTPLASVKYFGGVDILGVAVSGDPCGATELTNFPFTKYYKIYTDLFDGHGKDNASGFTGPFLRQYGKPLIATTVTGLQTLTGKVIPGLQTNIDSIKVYKRFFTDGNDNYRVESPDCSELTTTKYNFVDATVSGGTVNASGDFTVATSITSAEAGKSGAIVCPMKNGQFYGAGVYIGSDVFGSGTYTPMADSMTLVKPATKLATNLCTKFNFEGRFAGSFAYLPPNTNIYLSTTFPNLNFANNSSCTGATPNLLVNNANKDFYMEYTTTGTATPTFDASADNSLASLSLSIDTDDLPGTLTEDISIAVPVSTVNRYECNPVNYTTLHKNGAITMVANFSGNYTLNLPAASGDISYYSNSQCTSGISPTIGLGTTTTNVEKYFKYTGTGTTIDLTPTIAGYAGTYSGNGSSISINQPGTAAKFGLRGPNTVAVGTCTSAQIRIEDKDGRIAYNSTARTLQLSWTAGAAFYASGGCSGTVTSIGIAANASETTIYYKATVSGGGTLTISDATGGATTLNSTSLVITAP